MSQTAYIAKEKARPLRNNDPLAHVYLMQDSYDGSLAVHRMYTEFITDMGERLKDQPFRSTYRYSYTSNEITYDTGLQYIASLEQSYIAALNDVSAGTFSSYHAERQYAFYEQGKLVIDWLNNNEGSQHLLLFSLCPPTEELSYDEAKKQSFKPDRMMASIQLHSKHKDGTATTTAFSLDGVTCNRLNELLDKLGLPQTTKQTTLEQLTSPAYVYSEYSADVIVDTLIATYDAGLHNETNQIYKQGILQERKTVEANAFVASHPEVFNLYKKVIEQVASSLKVATVQPDLAKTVSIELVQQYTTTADIPYYLRINSGDEFTTAMASELVDYLRKRAIPEYLTQKIQTTHITRSGTYGDIGAAGASATQSGRVYDGACASSNTMQPIMSATEQAAQMGINVAVTYEVPKPLFIKGNYAVIPIGACPASCKTECGIGIQDRRSGEWYCANSKKCSAYNADIYDIVFNDTSDSKGAVHSQTQSRKNSFIRREITPNIQVGFELKETQNVIWMLRARMYDEAILDDERKEIISNLIDADLRKQQLLRVAMGYVTYEQLAQVG